MRAQHELKLFLSLSPHICYFMLLLLLLYTQKYTHTHTHMLWMGSEKICIKHIIQKKNTYRNCQLLIWVKYVFSGT